MLSSNIFMALPCHITWSRLQSAKCTVRATSKAGQHAVSNLKHLQALHKKNAMINTLYMSALQNANHQEVLNQSWAWMVAAAETNSTHAVTPAASFVMEYRQVLFYTISFVQFRLTWLENLHFSHLHDNFRLNMIWHKRSVAALYFGRRLPESDITACHQSHVWTDRIGDIIMRVI
jgi:hypothetical protein